MAEATLDEIKGLLEQAIQKPVEKKLLIAGENEGDEPAEVMFSDMDDELKVLYAKLEIVQKEGQNLQANANFKLEQNQILQNAYSAAIKEKLAKGDEPVEAEVVEDEPNGKSKTDVTKLELHEQICALRYENIEKRLDAGSKRFVRMELMILGLYATIIGTYVLEKVM